MRYTNDSSHKIHALVVAAGKGSRFGGNQPKQYQKIMGRYVLEHSIDRLKLSQIDDLTLVLAKDDMIGWQLDLDFHAPIHRVIGGQERWQSVKAGLQAIINQDADVNDWVLIHDAARPCLPRQDLLSLLDYVDQKYGAILVTPVVDTLKFGGSNQYVSHTVARDNLYQALTPQMFRLGRLQEALDYVDRHGLHITDEASAFERLGLPIALVQGSRLNMKLTYADDLPLLQAILQHFFN